MKPPCAGLYGVIRCPCARESRRYECLGWRQRYEIAECVAKLSLNSARRDYLALIAQTRGHAFAQDARAIAKEMIAKGLEQFWKEYRCEVST